MVWCKCHYCYHIVKHGLFSKLLNWKQLNLCCLAGAVVVKHRPLTATLQVKYPALGYEMFMWSQIQTNKLILIYSNSNVM